MAEARETWAEAERLGALAERKNAPAGGAKRKAGGRAGKRQERHRGTAPYPGVMGWGLFGKGTVALPLNPAGGDNLPRTPMVPLRGWGSRLDERCRGRRSRKAGLAMFWLPSQCRCVLSDPPAVADRCSRFAESTGLRKGFQDGWVEGIRQTSSGLPEIPACGLRGEGIFTF